MQPQNELHRRAVKLGLLPLLIITQMAVFALLQPSLAAGDATNQTVTVDGVTYEDVKWGTVSPSAVTIFHRTGIASIPLEKLPPEQQQRFGYNASRAAQHRKLEAEQRARTTTRAGQAAQTTAQRRAYDVERNRVILIAGALYPRDKLPDSRHVYGKLREKRPAGVVLEMDINETYVVTGGFGSVGGGGSALRSEKVGSELVFVRNLFPTNSIGSMVMTNAVETNPVGGIRAFDIGKVPTFDEWREAVQGNQKP
jgi:hypothetical protein